MKKEEAGLMKMEVAEIPPHHTRTGTYSKYHEIVDRCLESPGKAIKVPIAEFGAGAKARRNISPGWATFCSGQERLSGRTRHSRIIADHAYFWVDPPFEDGVKSA